jgi:hypothetical protein
MDPEELNNVELLENLEKIWKQIMSISRKN